MPDPKQGGTFGDILATGKFSHTALQANLTKLDAGTVIYAATAPASPSVGWLWFDTVNLALKVYLTSPSAAWYLFTWPAKAAKVHYGGAAVSIPSAGVRGAVYVTFDTLDYDTDGMWNAGTNTILTINTPGIYRMVIGGGFAPTTNPGEGAIACQVIRGGSTFYVCTVNSVFPANATIAGANNATGDALNLSATGDFVCLAGDLVKMWMWQNSSAAVLTATGYVTPTLSVSRIA